LIYTITFNPALDYIVSVDEFTLGKTNRTSEETLFPGGKGINVSIVLKNLGISSTALGFIAGFTGREIAEKLEKLGCVTDFIEIPNGFSRINMKLKNVEGTEINGQGPCIDNNNLNQLFEQLDKLKEEDILVLAGSIPASLPDSIYKDIMERLANKGILIVVDATKDLLINVLSEHPFLIKPNNHELGEIFGVTLKSKDEVLTYAKKLQEKGARNVLVSMAGEGAVFLSEDGQAFQMAAPVGKLVNAVGAGDSMVAGFLAGWLKSKNYKEAFTMGVATGSASAFSMNLATKDEVEILLVQIAQAETRKQI